MRSYLQLNFAILYWLVFGPFQQGSTNLKQFLRFYGRILKEAFHQMIRIGVEASPMASLTATSIGLTLAMQGANTLQRMGAEIYVPDLVAVSLLRELGPLLIAVIVIGRSGSSVTAELGTMKVSEEIEALEVMAINPVRFLVVPRFLAMMAMLPALTVLGNYVAMAGGWLVCYLALDMSTPMFALRSVEAATLTDLFSGMIKSVVFAWLIVTVACNAGMNVTGGAEGVGQSTTRSVVTSLLAVLVANAILTAIFFFL